MRALRHRDFLVLWLGALLSFAGSWVQSVAQGWQVNDLTHDASKVALVAFAGNAPIAIFGPFAGTISDTLNKRTVLVIAQGLYGFGAFYLGIRAYSGLITFWDIFAVALLFGMVGCVENPTRQSLVSRCVPPEDLAAAIPINAMTFNIARIAGSAVGGLLLAHFGPDTL
jgi:MFS family permease